MVIKSYPSLIMDRSYSKKSGIKMLECHILTSLKDINALANAWDELYARVGTDYFASYTPFKIWAETIAQNQSLSLHIIAGFREGKLKAVLPLVVSRKKGFRILFWAAYDAFLSEIALYEDENDLTTLWQFAAQNIDYDAAEIRYIRQGSVLENAIKTLPHATILEEDFVTAIQFKGMDSEAWLQSLPKKIRAETRRKIKNLHRAGHVALNVYRKDIPQNLIERMVELKKDWCIDKGFTTPAFFHPFYIFKLIGSAAIKDEVRFFVLTLDDTPIGFSLGFLCQKTLYTAIVAHDPAYVNLSPGVLALAFPIQWCADQGLYCFSFMEGREGFKKDYGNERHVILTYSFARTFRGHVARLLLNLRHTKI
ncbi:MAG: GNAT family N-acetyltransferase, partial [Bdellovibrionales bacterium]